MNISLVALIAAIPCAAYVLLLAAHAFHAWKYRKSIERGVILIDTITIIAYGMMTGFYSYQIASGIYA